MKKYIIPIIGLIVIAAIFKIFSDEEKKEQKRAEETEIIDKKKIEQEEEWKKNSQIQCRDDYGKLEIDFQNAKGWNDDVQKIAEIKKKVMDLLDSGNCSKLTLQELHTLEAKCNNEL